MFQSMAEMLPVDFRGELILPSDPGFDAARRVFNGMIDRRPALIARCTGVADIAGAIRLARELDLAIAVRSGGHSVAGHSVCDGGIVIDLGAMKRIRIDPITRRARVQAGATWGEFDHEAQYFGLATTGGRVSSTGVAGFALGGGSGYLERKHGYAADNITAIDLVTADGSFIQASASQHPGLFWAMRGAGANFGIVTEIEFQLHPVGPEILGGLMLFQEERIREILHFYRTFAMEAPRDLGLGAMLFTVPPLEHLPSDLHHQPAIGIMVQWTGDIAAGESFIAPLRALGPVLDSVGATTYRAMQAMADAYHPPYLHNHWKAGFLETFPDEAVDALAERVSMMASPLSYVLLFPVGGAIADLDEASTPLGGRNAQFSYHTIAVWADPVEQDRNVEWARTTDDVLRHWAGERVWLNYLGDEGVDRVQSAFGAEIFQRLQALKNEWDPENRFRLNQNIPPSAAADLEGKNQ